LPGDPGLVLDRCAMDAGVLALPPLPAGGDPRGQGGSPGPRAALHGHACAAGIRALALPAQRPGGPGLAQPPAAACAGVASESAYTTASSPDIRSPAAQAAAVS